MVNTLGATRRENTGDEVFSAGGSSVGLRSPVRPAGARKPAGAAFAADPGARPGGQPGLPSPGSSLGPSLFWPAAADLAADISEDGAGCTGFSADLSVSARMLPGAVTLCVAAAAARS